MKFQVFTLFPEAFTSYLNSSIMGRAQAKGIVETSFIDPRNFTTDKHRRVDDMPYGGGPGMVLKVDPIWQALTQSVLPESELIFFTASGEALNPSLIKNWARMPN